MTSQERKERFDAIARIGCVVCRIYKGVHTEPHIHHLTGLKYRSMGKKADDANSVGLCVWHHQGGSDEPSIHGTPAAFEEQFGTQEWLLDAQNKMIEAARIV